MNILFVFFTRLNFCQTLTVLYCSIETVPTRVPLTTCCTVVYMIVMSFADRYIECCLHKRAP